ncbi:alpha/beta hydrolase [Sphingomonas sp. H160509]|uniref:alpha/beta hydrolase n=1 Tax=Sphingomonas sp. H160509 TaxID=2955313 RepID=UPI002096D75B|nr:alpha/beta hydrolase [Sphingomonas sp. H160509]MDD1450334.1 alpha/beta hydrolase [Sphingomonas sp. H160509]
MRTLFTAIALLASAAVATTSLAGQDPAPEHLPRYTAIKLWPNGAPGSAARRGEAEIGRDYWVRNIHDPSLLAFPADVANRNGAAIVIMPGGGHKLLVWTNEGTKVATALNRMGVTAFVLKYRLANEPGSKYSVEGDAADDARRAMRWVRAHAVDYGIDPSRVGAMGFSAGGELVSLIADNPEPVERRPADPIDRQSARPDFQVLVFPGPRGIPATAIANAPPAFLVAGSRDPLLRGTDGHALRTVAQEWRIGGTSHVCRQWPRVQSRRVEPDLDPALAGSPARLASGWRLAFAPTCEMRHGYFRFLGPIMPGDDPHSPTRTVMYGSR